MMRSFSATVAGLVLCSTSWAQGPFEQQPQQAKGPWSEKTLSPDKRAELVLGEMTLDEKISLLHGGGWGGLFGPPAPGSMGGAGFIPGVPRLGIPDFQIADAAVGVGRSAIL